MARIAGVNIPQNKIVHVALTYIHGIGDKFSKTICSKLNIAKNRRTNSLTEDEVLKIREFIDKNYKVEGDLSREYSLNIKRMGYGKNRSPFFLPYQISVTQRFKHLEKLFFGK